MPFEAVFGMDLLHTTLPNGRKAFRLSCDTRWQPLDGDPPQGVNTGPWKAEEKAQNVTEFGGISMRTPLWALKVRLVREILASKSKLF